MRREQTSKNRKNPPPLVKGQNAPLSNAGFVTHSELLRLAQRRHCLGIHACAVLPLCRPEKNFWVFKATVYKSVKCRGFVGYGDAHPGNVSPLIFNNAEMRMAETRAVNRALRKAYGIGLCSLEELPPWSLNPKQLPQLRRGLQSQPPFQKGALRAYSYPGSESGKRKKTSGRRSVSRPSPEVRARRARR
jgi:hypothetical protein